jgi:hypothetical protein
MSDFSEREPGIIKEFRSLYDYVRLMGEHINQIHSRLERIERNLNETSVSLRNSIMGNAAEITNIKESMVNKFELGGFIEKLKASVGEELPPLPDMSALASLPSVAVDQPVESVYPSVEAAYQPVEPAEEQPI